MPVLSKEDPKYVDLLDEDPPIQGQKFVCVSFISPETVLRNRELYIFEEFTKQWDMAKSMTAFSKFLQFMSVNYNLDIEPVMVDYKEFIESERAQMRANAKEIECDFKNFKDLNEEKITETFNRENDFQTSVRGVKFRGVFSNQRDAENHSAKLRKNDVHHDIYVAPCGFWLPWDPSDLKSGKVDYLEPELNRLHEEKIKNEISAKNEFDERIKAAKRAAIAANIEMAKKTGNKLTQSIDEAGNLKGVMDTVDFEKRDVVDADQREAHEKSVFANVPK